MRSLYIAEIQGEMVTIGGVSELAEDAQKLREILGSTAVGNTALFHVENKKYTASGYGIILEYTFDDKSDEKNTKLTYRLKIRASSLR